MVSFVKLSVAAKMKNLQTLDLYTRYPIVARALGRVRARAKESCIQTLDVLYTTAVIIWALFLMTVIFDTHTILFMIIICTKF